MKEVILISHVAAAIPDRDLVDYVRQARRAAGSNRWAVSNLVAGLRTEAGIRAPRLAEIGYTAEELWLGGYTQQEILRSKFKTAADSHSRFESKQVVDPEYSLDDLIAGFNLY